MDNAFTAVVIVNFNTADLLKRCLDSLLPQIDLKRDEVIVIDNASSDGSDKMVAQHYSHITLIRNPVNKGYSNACNLGWKSTQHPFVLFCNSDVAFPQGQYEKIKQAMVDQPNAGILSPVLLGEQGRFLQMTWLWDVSLIGEAIQRIFSPKNINKHLLIYQCVEYFHRHLKKVSIVTGACIITRRKMLEQIDGFDEKFQLYFEDVDLCTRARKNGYDIVFTPFVHVLHGLGQSRKSIPLKVDLVYRQSQIGYYRKHRSALMVAVLKYYLLVKFLFSKRYWSDPLYKRYMTQVIHEMKPVNLSDEL